MKFAIALAFIGLAFAGGKYFQRPVENVIGGCDPPKIPAPEGKPYAEGQAFADKILAMIGLPSDVKVYLLLSPEFGWAEPQYRRIYIGRDHLYKNGKIRWPLARTVAHEIGHVLEQNDLSGRDAQDDADEFTGWVLHRLGATLDETLSDIVNREAKVAVERGWRKYQQ